MIQTWDLLAVVVGVANALVVNQTVVIVFLIELVHGCQVVTGKGFVPQRPEGDRRVVLEVLVIAPGPVDHSFLPLRN